MGPLWLPADIEHITWPSTVATDLQNAGPHSGEPILTRTAEVRERFVPKRAM